MQSIHLSSFSQPTHLRILLHFGIFIVAQLDINTMSVPVPDKLRNSHGAMVVWATVVQNKASSWPPSLQSTSPSPIRFYTSSKEPYVRV
jgi:hypothetical protein